MKILVIDDDYLVRYAISKTLRRGGYDFLTAADGARGVILYRTERPDLVITDLIMPAQDGVETIAQIRELDPAAKIIAISGGARTMNANGLAQALEAGADGVIVKPFDPEHLLARVAECLTASVR